MQDADIALHCSKMAAVIQNPLKALGDQFYKDAIEQCRSYNARLCAERSVRLPFLDSQTGGSQPGRCIHTPPVAGERRDGCTTPRTPAWASTPARPEHHAGGSAARRGLEKRNSSKNDEDSLLEIQRVLEADAAEDAFNEDDDFEVDTPKKRHRGKGRGRGSGRKKAEVDEDKPYVCDMCANKRYRNRTGLSYHYTNSHLAEEGRAGERSSVASKSPAAQQTDRHKRPKGPSGTSIPNNYCNKCQGSIKKTADRGAEKEDGTFTGAEELFGTTSESDTSTFHGFEDDDLEEPATNSNGISKRHR
ncbi:hypothetical protein F7725_007929 [Dissostichus mawsoni]|uniref:DPF1-3 N-terminal domain-containing protein n=1 Tax=Dissostichus mawsoni TaxID=36200 RepID=A0A7J5Y5Q6_DISMA|nr:hypothetical protein F7725_007929 [Dissostichus mawsoni]